MVAVEGALALEHVVGPAPDDPLAGPVGAILAGWPGRAIEALTDAAREGDDATRSRAVAWATYASGLRANAYPGGTVANGIEVTRRWPALWTSLPAPPSTPPEITPECELVGLLLPRLRMARSPLGGGFAPDPGVVEGALAALDRFEPEAGPSPLRGLCRRARADLLHRAGRGDAAAAALERDRVAVGDDAVGLAAHHLLVGDQLLAPLTHPDAADHVLYESGLETSTLPWPVEAREADPAAADPDGAAAAYDAAAAVARPDTSPEADLFRAVLTLRRAGVARARGDHRTSVSLADEAERAASAADNGWLTSTAAVHGSLGRVAAGQVTAASAVPEQVGTWGAGDGSFTHAFGLGLLLARAGRRWLVRGGDAERAAECAELARRLFDALGAGTQASQSLADAAAALHAIGAVQAALVRLERALDEHLGRTTDPVLGADAWGRATTLAVRVHGLHLAGDDPAALRRSGAQLGRLAARDLGADEAGPGYEALREVAGELHAATEVQALLGEGDAARDAGDLDLAHDRYASAVERAGAGGDHLGRASALARLGRVEEAAAAYAAQQADDAADLERRLAELRAQLGDGADAIIAELDQTGNVLRRAAAFHTRIGASAVAAETFDQLDAHEPGWHTTEARPWELLSDHGHVREQLGELDRAAELHAEATAALDARASRIARDELSTALHGGSGRTFGRAARTELRRAEAAGAPLGPHAEAAFVLAERGRARALAQLLAGGSADAATLDADHPVRSWAAASARLGLVEQLLAAELTSPTADEDRVRALRERVTAHEAELAARRDDLRARAPEVAEAVAPVAAPTVAEVAAALPADGVLVSHLLVDDDLLIWAIGSDGLLVAERRDVDARALARDLAAFATGCARGGPWIEPARRVAELLLGPAREVLGRRRRLYLVPTGGGHAAPLQALPFADGLLLDHLCVAVLPSATLLRHLAPAPVAPPPPPALVVGDPEGASLRTPTGVTPAAPLPGARSEASAVAARFPGTLLTGAAATVRAVTAALGDARFVHLAAHAAVSAAAPLATAVLLADGGQLTVADLVGRRLVADLVVLSACDSGRGHVTGGEEVLGMTRAILAAGSSAAVVSLWPVDDRSTAVLMSRFADGVAEGLDPALALQRAQRWFRELDEDGRSRAFAAVMVAGAASGDRTDGPVPDGTVRAITRSEAEPLPPLHPFHWAAFVHVGAHGGA